MVRTEPLLGLGARSETGPHAEPSMGGRLIGWLFGIVLVALLAGFIVGLL